MWFLMTTAHVIRTTKELIEITRRSRMISRGSTEIVDSILAESGMPRKLCQELLSNENMSKVEPFKMKALLSIFKELGFPLKDLKRCNKLMLKCPYSLDNKFKILEEGGFVVKKINITMLKKKSIPFKSLASLKHKGYMEKIDDVESHILSYTDFPQYLYPPKSDVTLTFLTTQNEAVKKYLSWKLALSDEELQERLDTYSSVYFKSLRLIIQTYNMLINDLGFNRDKIIKNFFLLGVHPMDIQTRLEQLPTIGNVPIRSIASTYPKILVRPIEKVLEIIKILKENNFSEEDFGLTPGLFLLGPETVKRRVALLGEDPFFKSLCYLPRFGSAIVSYKKMVRRTKRLKEITVRSPSLFLLHSNEKMFEARIEKGSEFSHGEDVVQFLKKTFKKPRKEVAEALKVVPQWYHGSLPRVQTNLWLLQDSGLSQTQIWNDLTVLLYPTDELKNQLDLLESRPEVDCCRDTTGRLRPELVLQLVLYFMEQPFHFTGNGIWKDTNSNSKNQLSDQSSYESMSLISDDKRLSI